MKNILMKFLAGSLWQQPAPFSELDVPTMKELFKASRAQSVAAMMGDYVIGQSLRSDFDQTTNWLNWLNRAHHTYWDMLHDVAAVARVLEEEGIRYVVFKGVMVARYYNKPWTRTMGDADFYFPPGDYGRAVALLERRGALFDKGTEKHVSFVYHGFRFELHHSVETFGCRRHQRYFDRLIEASLPHATTLDADGVPVKGFDAITDLLVIFKHMFNHLLMEGVGLRHFCDLAALLKCKHDEIDGTLLEEHLRAMGYLRAYKAVMAFLVEYLEMDPALALVPLQASDSRFNAYLFDVVKRGGNFGYGFRKGAQPHWWVTLRLGASHFAHLLPLAPSEILGLVPKRIAISLRMRIRQHQRDDACTHES